MFKNQNNVIKESFRKRNSLRNTRRKALISNKCNNVFRQALLLLKSHQTPLLRSIFHIKIQLIAAQ